VLSDPNPFMYSLKRSEVEVFECGWRIAVSVIVLTRSRVDEYLIRFGNRLPLNRSIGIIWQVLGTVLQCKPLV
jgi:hypothetical protein